MHTVKIKVEERKHPATRHTQQTEHTTLLPQCFCLDLVLATVVLYASSYSSPLPAVFPPDNLIMVAQSLPIQPPPPARSCTATGTKNRHQTPTHMQDAAS